MKLALLADTHANLRALEAVVEDLDRWQPDVVVFAGDLINRGPLPRETMELILTQAREKGWHLLRGNHDEFVIDRRQEGPSREPFLSKLYQHTHWTCGKLGDLVGELERLPSCVELPAPGGGTLHFTHASMAGITRGVFPVTTDEELAQLFEPGPVFYGVGHTHVPLVRAVHGATVVNAGSVGLPFDGDPRACYVRLSWRDGAWENEFVRLAYDRTRAARDFRESGYLEEGGPIPRLVLDELKHARSRIAQWHMNFENRILAGEISFEESIDWMLEHFS